MPFCSPISGIISVFLIQPFYGTCDVNQFYKLNSLFVPQMNVLWPKLVNRALLSLWFQAIMDNVTKAKQGKLNTGFMGRDRLAEKNIAQAGHPKSHCPTIQGGMEGSVHGGTRVDRGKVPSGLTQRGHAERQGPSS